MNEPTSNPAGHPAGQAPESPAPLDLDDTEGNPSLVADFFYFLKENKKWWLIPMVLLIVILGLLIVAGSSSTLGPMIYSFF